MKFEWECIFYDKSQGYFGGESTKRAKVFGGWLVRHAYVLEENPKETMVFIPDPNHEWNGIE